MAYQTALSYEYITSFTNEELYELEELCIATQDTVSLERIARVRGWRRSTNRTPVNRTHTTVVNQNRVVRTVPTQAIPVQAYNVSDRSDEWDVHYVR